ncbi:MAG: hypothetical protein RL172_2823 [Bacteroidota bacterium]|jgi:hypothetical protein
MQFDYLRLIKYICTSVKLNFIYVKYSFTKNTTITQLKPYELHATNSI